MVGLGQLLGLGDRGLRIVAGVFDDGFNRTTTQSIAVLLQKEQKAVALPGTRRPERPGEFGEDADLDRRLGRRLCKRGARRAGGQNNGKR